MNIDTKALIAATPATVELIRRDLDKSREAQRCGCGIPKAVKVDCAMVERLCRIAEKQADRLAALEAELASMRTDRCESRATTHADDCWSWGPGHYKCAVGKIERLREDAARHRLLRKGAVEDVAVVRGMGAMDYGMSAVIGTYSEEIDGDDLDAAIDEAMGKGVSND